jgi:hypothetical protein
MWQNATMSPTSEKQRLLEFLDQRVFQPVATANPLTYSDTGDRKLLKSVQHRVHGSRTRYVADYPDAAAIKANFIQDLNSKPGQELANDMWLLKLTRFADVQSEFLALCKQLGV